MSFGIYTLTGQDAYWLVHYKDKFPYLINLNKSDPPTCYLEITPHPFQWPPKAKGIYQLKKRWEPDARLATLEWDSTTIGYLANPDGSRMAGLFSPGDSLSQVVFDTPFDSFRFCGVEIKTIPLNQ